MTTLLLTGMPRSGTSLVCAMLNEQPDTVALVEPMRLMPHGDAARAVRDIDAFIAETRASLLRDGIALSKHIGGAIPENTVAQDGMAAALRPVAEQHGEVRISKALTPTFRLIIKHPAMFSALAPSLAQSHGLHALVRHPLAVLASWQTVDMPVNRGRMPMAEAFCPALARQLDRTADPLARQIVLIEWLLTTYSGLPPERVLRYEDVLANPSRHLAGLSGREHTYVRPRQPHDLQKRYAGVDLGRLATALMPLAPVASRFYPDFEVSLSNWSGQAA